MRRKTNLDDATTYATWVACERIAAMFSDSLRTPTVRRIWREHEQIKDFDDIVEERLDPVCLVGWQIRRVTTLDKSDITVLLRALHAAPQIHLGILATPGLFEIEDLCDLSVLHQLCNRCREATDFRDLTHYKTEQVVLTRLTSSLTLSQADVLQLLARFEARATLGDVDAIRERVRHQLERSYGGEVGSLMDRLFTSVTSTSGTMDITPAWVGENLQASPRGALFPQRTVNEVRAQYLRSTIAAWEALRPLVAPARVARASPALATVYVDRELTSGEGSELTRWSTDRVRDAAMRGESFAILAAVGTGKTAWLRELAMRVATHAQTSASPVLPLLIHARELPDLAAFAQAHSDIRELSLSSESWIILIDGIDEVGPQAWSQVASLKQHYPSVCGVVATSRETTPPDGATGVQQLRLREWDRLEVERFLTRWEVSVPTAVARVRAHVATTGGEQLLLVPLTATVLLCLASEDAPLPVSRAALIGRACEFLFLDWRELRGARELSWARVRPVLASLALRQLTGERLTRRLVSARFAQEGLTMGNNLHYETQELGFLQVSGDGVWEFSLRSLAEHLAAEQLRTTPESLVETAMSTWGMEVSRHAFGLEHLEEPNRIDEPLMRLAAIGSQAISNVSSVRCCLVLIDILADLALEGSHRENLRAVTTELVCCLVHDETSTWIPLLIAARARRFAGAGGVQWDDIKTALVARQQFPHPDLQRWHRAQAYTLPDWIGLLSHRHAALRSLALRELAQLSPTRELDEVLVTMLHDDGYDMASSDTPALVAAVALRARSDRWFTGLLQLLVVRGEQLRSGVAAVALQPNEAPVMTLVTALRRLAGRARIPTEVIDSLRQTPDGEAAFAMHPGEWWRSDTWAPPTQLDGVLSDFPPPTEDALTALFQLCEPRLSEFTDEELRCVFGAPYERVRTSHALRGLDPASLQRLDVRQLLGIDHVELGAVLLRNPALREWLLALWPSAPSVTPEMPIDVTFVVQARSFPGRALEGLVLQQDEWAIRVYSSWLPYSNAASLPSFDQIPPSVLAVPSIGDAARRVALVTLQKVLAEFAGDRLSPQTAGIVLRNLASAWSADENVISRIPALIEMDLMAGVYACAGNDVSPQCSELLVQALTAYMSGLSPSTASLDVTFTLPLLIDSQFVAPLSDELWRLADVDSFLGWNAYSVLWSTLTRERRAEVSSLIAPAAIAAHEVDLKQPFLIRLVEAAPEAWHTAALLVVETHDLVQTAVPRVLRLLPRGMQATLGNAIQGYRLAQADLPWRSDQSMRLTQRPADWVRQVLFETGVVQGSSYDPPP